MTCMSATYYAVNGPFGKIAPVDKFTLTRPRRESIVPHSQVPSPLVARGPIRVPHAGGTSSPAVHLSKNAIAPIAG
jgi:hypothetical protein